MKKKVRRKHGLRRWLFRLLVLFLLITVLPVCLYRFIPVYYTPLMFIRVVEQIGNDRQPTINHRWVSLDKISPHLVQAVVASEDNLFVKHWGFDFVQIKKAFMENRHRARPRGASTISQQTAKNVFLWPQSSYLRKCFEAYFTILIELIWGKERIMEVYLNSIEMGDGIYGAESVARYHFGKSAKALSASESAIIAATLPNPRLYSSAKPSPYVKQRGQQIRRLMRLIGKVEF